MRLIIFISLALPAFCSNVLEGELLEVAKRQHPIGMPCKGYEFICRTLSTAVCCHGYCHYTCNDLPRRPIYPVRPPPPKPVPTTEEPTTEAELPVYVPTPKPCVVNCKDGNVKTTLSPEAPVGCSLDFQSVTVRPEPYNATHSVIRDSYQICCPATFAG
ncbi:uncharacterized protein [Amphiura filiformis]|uniref:uncharacterized protein isoform X2 n=1 Tax=Amphiura filiformis TaxID=82378 RepID=UPI003B22151F